MTQEELQKLLDEFGQSEIALTPQWKIDNADRLRNQAGEAGKIGGNTYSKLRNKKCSELGKKTGPRNVYNMVKNRRSYKGEGNHKCKITEEKAQQILDDYTNLVKEGHRAYGLYQKVHKLHQDVTKRIVVKICERSTWKHLTPMSF